MAWSFGDSFDLYATPADMINGYWDSQVTPANQFLQTGRFAGSRAFVLAGANSLVKSSGVNDPVHHFVVSFQQTAAISGSTLGNYFELFDGATAQCSIVFRSDGAILLQSGAPGGTTLATYTGAFPVASTWYAFEFEVVINNTTGSIAVRKNGNTGNDFFLGSLNTRPTSTNNYANKLQIGQSALVNAQAFDDLFWQSGAATGSWLGDIRCYARMPASDQSVTFSKSPTNMFAQGTANVTSGSFSANNIRLAGVTAPTSGTVTSLTFNFGAALTGHAKMALYDASFNLLASSAELTNPGAGVNTFTVAGGPAVQRGVVYNIALWSDVAITGLGLNSNWSTPTQALTYTTAFPSVFVNGGNVNNIGYGSNGMNVTPFNAGLVSEAQQDGLTSYVFDSNPGDADFYGIGSIASTPATVIATTVRAYMQKSDAGTRTAAVQLKSGATTVASSAPVLTSSGFVWAWRTDTTDPNTGAAWTAAAVNNAQVGPTVIT